MVSDLHGLWILGVSVAALLVGPAIHRVARREPVTMAALDNFVLVVVVGLVTLEIFPAALALAGPLALLALLLGALGPALADGPLHRASHGTHAAALTLGIVGVVLHSITDGVALASAHAHGSNNHALEAAVIAHQLPVSVAVWWLLSPVGPVRATAAMIGLGLATIAGFLLADGLLAALDTAWLGALQALFAGFLLHVLAHRSGPVDPHGSHAPRARIAASLGGLVGVALLALLALDDHAHADDHLTSMPDALADLARASAPVLLAALALRRGATAILHALDRAAPWLTASLLIAPTLAPHANHVAGLLGDLIPGLSAGLPFGLQLLLLAALAVPIHALAPALPPLAALLVPLGLAPGAALAFILTGPAASASRSTPTRLALVLTTLAAALLLNLVDPAPSPTTSAAAALTLALILLVSLVRQTPQQFLRRLWSPPGHAHAHAHTPRGPSVHSHAHHHE